MWESIRINYDIKTMHRDCLKYEKNIRFAAQRMRGIFKLTQSNVGISNYDQSWRSDSLSRPNVCEIFFFCTLKKVWLAISSTELRRRVVVAPIPAGRRREEPAGEVAESLVDLAPRYFYAGDFRLEIRSALGYSTSFWENKSACWVYKIAKKYDFEFWTENWGPYSHSM